MMDWESFGDLIIQVLSNLREDMQRNLEDMEGVLDLEKAFYRGISVSVASPSVSLEQASPTRDENPPKG